MEWSKHFSYRKRTGELVWKYRNACPEQAEHKRSVWNGRFAGTVAGTKVYREKVIPTGMHVKIYGRIYYVGHVVWQMHNGPIPEGLYIDHINGDPFDNRIENLRLATPAQNAQNRRAHRNNKCGILGVNKPKRFRRWVSTIQVNGKDIYLGSFDTAEQAGEAYQYAARKYRGEFVRVP